MDYLLNNTIILVRNLGLTHWLEIFKKMHFFTKNRGINTFDEIWFVEHYPIFTHGQSEGTENIISSNSIPIVQTDRGGKITYHGPGQQIIYFLINLKNRKIGIRQLIHIMQNTVIDTLHDFLIYAYAKKNFPGVYIQQKKISSLGLRIIHGSTLHGLSLNVNMDLMPFNYINPCGDKNIKMTQMKDFNNNVTMQDVRKMLKSHLSKNFGADVVHINTYPI